MVGVFRDREIALILSTCSFMGRQGVEWREDAILEDRVVDPQVWEDLTLLYGLGFGVAS